MLQWSQNYKCLRRCHRRAHGDATALSGKIEVWKKSKTIAPDFTGSETIPLLPIERMSSRGGALLCIVEAMGGKRHPRRRRVRRGGSAALQASRDARMQKHGVCRLNTSGYFNMSTGAPVCSRLLPLLWDQLASCELRLQYENMLERTNVRNIRHERRRNSVRRRRACGGTAAPASHSLKTF